MALEMLIAAVAEHPAPLQRAHKIKSLCVTIIFVIFLSKNIYFCFLLASQGVKCQMSHVQQVMFSA